MFKGCTVIMQPEIPLFTKGEIEKHFFSSVFPIFLLYALDSIYFSLNELLLESSENNPFLYSRKWNWSGFKNIIS